MSTEESTKAVEDDERFTRAVESLKQFAALHAAGQLPAEYVNTLHSGAMNLWRFYYGQAWQRLKRSFWETVRSLPNTDTLEIIDAFWQLASQEARARVAKETGCYLTEINVPISADFAETVFDSRRHKPTSEKQVTEAEYMEILEEWATWRAQRWTQEEFAAFKGWKSRTPLTKALRWYKETYGKDFLRGNTPKQKRR